VAKGLAHEAMGIKANGKSRHSGFSVTAIRKIITRDVQIRQLFSTPKAHLRHALRLSHQFRQLRYIRRDPPPSSFVSSPNFIVT
jgi:hypothetical protein